MIFDKIADRYGSKRGLLNTLKYQLFYWLGVYRLYTNIDFSRVRHIVFLCSGNICRSSLAEYIARDMSFSCESFGLHCRGGDPADTRAIDYAKRHGIVMDGHLTRNIAQYQSQESHLLVAMEPAHLLELQQFDFNCQITSLPIWAIDNIYLHDPYSTNSIFFERCEDVVKLAVNQIISKTTQI